MRFFLYRAHGANEMCNFYMYYYVDADKSSPFGALDSCSWSGDPNLFKIYPAEASTPFAENVEMTEMAMSSAERFGKKEKSSVILRKKRGDFNVDSIDDDQNSVDERYNVDFNSVAAGPYLPVRKKPGPGARVNGRLVWNGNGYRTGQSLDQIIPLSSGAGMIDGWMNDRVVL